MSAAIEPLDAHPSPPPLHPSLPTSLPRGERRLESPFSTWEKGGDEGIMGGDSRCGCLFRQPHEEH
jgi:hypothetical protein